MTPTHTDLPLRRSEAGLFREGLQNVTFNDDDEERRQARRRTILQSSTASECTSIEDNETIKKCLDIYNCNKLSKDNAWSLSLIDTLSTLLDRHHKSLNNFKVAGSSLEASSKVYSLRVDSIHTDVLRMSAGLNAQKFSEKNLEDDDDDSVATGGDGASGPNASAAVANEDMEKGPSQAKAKQKRQRKAVCTVTKNKDTLNARLDTVPAQDPIFGKLNSVVGSTNSSNRLMNNILLTRNSELLLNTNFRFWDSKLSEVCNYTEEVPPEKSTPENEVFPFDRLSRVLGRDNLHLRPLHLGYIISDMPEPVADEKDARRPSANSNFDSNSEGTGNMLHNAQELSMAFDMDAECEPIPELNAQAPIIDVDYGEFDDLSTEERMAINNCRGLRKAPVLIEDLRPIDSTSELEYSYRPLDKISQFWAGPSHWKFKRMRSRPTSHLGEQDNGTESCRTVTQRSKRPQSQAHARRRAKLNFGEFHDELFIKLDDKYKGRKVNFQKKWDQRKLKLPTDLQLDPELFFKFKYAPGIKIDREPRKGTPDDSTVPATNEEQPMDATKVEDQEAFEDHFADNSAGVDFMGVSTMSSADNDKLPDDIATKELEINNSEMINNTVLEIATEFEGAPSKITKIIVPFAKRAKVIDMKNLKLCCTQILRDQLKRNVSDNNMPVHPIAKNEEYSPGVGSFRDIYEELPNFLSPSMSEALSTSVAVYSMLHLANDYNLRLIPQDDLEDFKIRQVQ